MITCPNCNGNLKFNVQKQRMFCDFCNADFDPYEFDSKNKDGIESDNFETTVFTCPECAGEISSTDTDVTGFCPFCGASTIFYSRLQEEKKPDFIIPFIKSKEDCKKAYFAKAKKSLFLPKEYKDEKYVEGFRGIYMPYWSYDISQNGYTTVEGERSHRSGDYIIHDYYNVSGDLNAFYNGISYDASSSFSDDISQRIAPFDVKAKKPFTAGFLSGFYADTADVSEGTYKGDALEFAQDETYRSFKKHPSFTGMSIKTTDPGCKAHMKLEKTQRTMFPVWFMCYRKNDRVAYATVNGQTGKVAADLPIDIKKFLIFALVLAGVIYAILNFLVTAKARTSTLAVGIMALFALLLYLFEANEIRNRDNKVNDKGFLNKEKKKGKKDRQNLSDYKFKKVPIVLSIVAIAICLVLWLINTIYDDIYYVFDFVAAAFICVTLIYLIKDYNILTTRRLPQFDKKGGDDNA